MRLTFLGATHEVTGSCYYLEAAGKKFLVDCGMEQGPNIYENKPIPVPASQLDFVLITHAHIDHTGNLPLLYAHGFRGPIYMTPATVALSDIMLRDSAHIQLAEAEWRNRKNRRAGKEDYVTPYTMEDALGVIRLLEGIPYHQRVTLSDGIQIRFLDAGHLLGSASIELWLTEDGVTKKLLFSGDIGNIHQPLINDPEYPESADYVIMESTYGDRSHGPKPDYVPELAKIIQETLDRGGNLVIPSFAVGRTQEMLYFIREIKAEHLVHGHGEFPVYVDSPLAVEATNIFRDHQKECYDSDAAALLAQGINPILFPGLKLSITSDESKAINFNETPRSSYPRAHVRCRTNQASSEAQPLAAGEYGSLRRLSGRRYTGTGADRRREGSETVPGRGSCERAHHPVPGHERPRRSGRTAQMGGQSAGKTGPRFRDARRG